MQESLDDEQNVLHAVVDGQQRIRTVLQFIGAEEDAEEVESNDFRLEKLEPLSPWYGKGFADLTPKDQTKVLLYRFTVRVLEAASDEEVREMFVRLNKNLTK